MTSSVPTKPLVNLMSALENGSDFQLHPIRGGANNQVFRVESRKKTYLLKFYFQHDADPRDRLGTEFEFMTFAWKNGIKTIPEPIICDKKNRLALYEYVEGRRLSSGDVNDSHIKSAIDFFLSLHSLRNLRGARQLPSASEACFSMAAHLQHVEQRVSRLLRIQAASKLEREAMSFVQERLAPSWQHVAHGIQSRFEQLDISLEEELPSGDRCLSPSDFGFHNAILTTAGALRFIDFEYAGWDDPAKFVSDFFCQPSVVIPIEVFPLITKTIVMTMTRPDFQQQRINLLLPLYRIKWSCILLNDFLPSGNARRQFALSDMDTELRKERQLSKARAMLRSLEDQQIWSHLQH